MLKLLFLVVILFGNVIAVPGEGDAFSVWLESLKAEARAEKISEQTITSAFKDAQYLPSVIELDRSQPEFISTFSSYISKRVTETRIDDGRYKLYENKALLEKVEQQYGVPKNIIVAFWGLETNYGGYKGNYGLPSALMTLAYEGRRGDFFRNQLMDMMRIVDASHNNIEGMRGSWAGAMGICNLCHQHSWLMRLMGMMMHVLIYGIHCQMLLHQQPTTCPVLGGNKRNPLL